MTETSAGVTNEKIVENSKGTKTITSEFKGNDGEKISITGTITKAGKTTLNVTEEAKDGTTEKFQFTDTSSGLILAGFESDTKNAVIPSEINVGNETLKVTVISMGTFADDKKVESIELGSAVTKIEKGAFDGAENLREIVLTAGKLKTIEEGAFEGISNKTVIKVKGTKKQYKALKKLLKASGLSKKVKLKRVSK